MKIFENFQNACDGYKAVNVDDECLAYFSEAETRVWSTKERTAIWMESQRKPLVDQEDPEVRPEDSISKTKTRSMFPIVVHFPNHPGTVGSAGGNAHYSSL